jgi:uncharacterized repeat protein (TIGR01451 family)
MSVRRCVPLSNLLILVSVAAVLAGTSAFAQTTYTWNQTGTAAYTTAGNWTPSRGAPAANDVLVFNNGATTTVTAVPTQTIGQLLVSGNTNVTMQADAAAPAVDVLTLAGGAGDDLAVAPGSQLNVNTANALNITVGAGATGNIGGAMTYSAGAHLLRALSAPGITFQNGSTFTAGTGFSGNPFGTTAPFNAVIFASGSTYVYIAGSNPFGAGQPSSVVVFQTGSLFRQTGTGTPAFSGRTYANFELNNGAASPAVSGGSAVSIDNLTITAGTLNWGMTGTGSSVKGNISIAAGATLNFNPTAAGTLNLNGPAAQVISVPPFGLTVSDADQTININNPNGVTFNDGATFNAGTLQLTSGNITTLNTFSVFPPATVNRTSGHVIGTMRTSFGGPGSWLFPVGTANGYSPATVNVTAGSGFVFCAAVQGPQPNMNPATSIQRYWTLDANASVTAANLTFEYLNGDVMGNEALYKIFRVNGGVPTPMPSSVVNAGTNTATLAGVTIAPFSDWTVGEYVPALPQLTVTDVSQTETNGATTFTFQVNLSAPAGPGGVTFDIATADGTAQDDNPVSEDNDYAGQSLTSQTIAAGNSSYAFNVTVNGDIAPEANETFFVNVSNISGAVGTDSQGQGTITNDDVSCASLSINDVTQAETNAGTTTFAFTAGLSQAGCGTVTFDIATADGTAQDDNPVAEDNDYVPQSLTGQTITFPATYTFNVTVNGDITAEPDQTFFVNITNVSPGNVQVSDGQGLGTIVNDDFTRIHDVQGNGSATPIPGATVTIEGVVTGDFQPITNDNRLSGFFVQEENADFDANPLTSEGIFVFCSACPTNVAEGQKVQVTGTVSEFNNLTEITATTAGSVVITNAGNNLGQVSASTIDLPVTGVIDDFYEPKESMLVTFVDTLTISEYFEQARYGRIELYEGARPRTFNESNPPSVAGFAAHNDNLNRRRVYLDDDDNVENSVLNLTDGQQFVFHPQANGGLSARNAANTGPGVQGTDFFRGGDTISSLRGILHFSFSGGTSPNEWRVRPVAASPAAFTAVNVRPPAPPAVGGAIRAASVNVLNYFTTLNVRGADSTAELNRQRERTSIVLCALNPDVAALMEIENHATNATITDLLGDVNTRCGGTHPYAFVNTGGALGTDQIRVLLIYRTGVLSPVGAPLSDMNAVHNRPPTAQTFDVVDPLNPAFGKRFTALANHSKSKSCSGAGGADLDQNDGQACFAATRLAQANRIITWVNGTVIPAAGDPDVLMLGDFNAYPQETSAAAISSAGFSDLETAFLGSAAYSYLFDGQIGHIDYAWSSASLTPQVTGVTPWHINADENPLFDYNDEIQDGAAEQAFEEKPDGSALAPPRVMFQAATAQRASDHDPVLLGLFQIANVSLTKTLDTAGPYFPGQSVTYTITVANAGPDPATNIQVTDTPTNLSITGVSGSGCISLPCTIPSLAAGANTAITVTATIVAAGAFDNSAAANAAEADPNTGNNTDNTSNGGTAAASANVSITKTLDTAGPYYEGQSVTYTLTVANAGPSTATNIQVTDTPTNLSITSVTGSGCVSLPCTIPSLASGANTAIIVTATIGAAGAFDNSAAANAAEADPNTGNNTDNTSNGGTAAASANVSITKTLDTAGPYYAGTSVTYTITVANGGPSTATNVSVTDTPSNLSITNVSGACASFSPCTIASIASGGNAIITVTATIAAAGAFDNTASVTATENDPNGGNNTDNAGGTASASADVSITKTLDTAPPYNIGQSVTYTITVANAGPSPATNIQVTDTPTNLTITNVSGACASFPCTIPTLASGANTNITVTATIGSSGQFVNAATANGAEADPNNTNNSTSASAVASQTNVVDVTKAVSGTFVQGTNVTYTIVMTNTMTVNQPDNFGHEFTDNLPAGLTLVPGSFTATSGTNGSVSNIFFWDGSIPSGGTVTLTFQATISPTATGPICNQGQSIFDKDGDNQNESSELTDDPSTAAMNDSTCFTVLQANVVEVTKAVSGTFVQGTNVTYTIVMTNNMTVTQPNNFGHEFTDNLPAGLTLIPGSFTATSGTNGSVSNIFFWDGSIPSGGSVTLTFQATISPSATGSICNQGQSIFDKDGDNQNESSELTDDPSTAAMNDSTCFTVLQANVVEVTKAVSGTFVQGTNVTYTIVMTNNLTVTQPDNFGHEFTDNLPAGLTLVPGSFTATSGTNGSVSNIFFWDGSIPSGGSVTLTFQATISPSATGSICNQGQSIFDKDGDNQNESSELTDDPSTGANNDPTCFTVLQANVVEVTKAVSGTFVQGTNVTYTIVMTNNMTVTQPNNFGHEFTDNLPAGLTLIPGSFTATSGTNGSVSNIFFWDGSIPSGGSVTLTFQATISPSATGSICNQGQSIFDKDGDNQNESSELTDNPSTGANNDPTCFTVLQANVVEVTKAVSGTFVQGTNVTYTIVMTNNLTVTQPDNFGHEFTDNLPAGLTLVPGSFTATSGTNGSVSNIFFWDGSIPSGGSVTLTFQATISPSATGSICNQGQSIFDKDGDNQNESSELTDNPSTGANNDPTCFTVIPTGTVSATKTVSGTFTQGSSITYTIVVTNNMGITQPNNAGNELTDVLPPSLTLVSANATSGTASANVGTNTVSWNGSLAAGASVTITINTTINNTATGSVSNQASIAYDADGNGSNEASGVSNDPGTAAPNDPTSFTVNTGGGDTDGDGVLDTIEQGAPNGGDGNGDGISDRLQNTVASIPAANGNGYLTLQSSCPLQQVSVTSEGAMPAQDPGFHYPVELIAFRAPCSSATFSLFVYGSGAASAYRKFGPNPPGGPQQWYGIPATFTTATVGSLNPRRVDFSLTDGGTGDDTPVDGVIVDQGGPAEPTVPIPTLSEWMLLLMAALLAAVAALMLKR